MYEIKNSDFENSSEKSEKTLDNLKNSSLKDLNFATIEQNNELCLTLQALYSLYNIGVYKGSNELVFFD